METWLSVLFVNYRAYRSQSSFRLRYSSSIQTSTYPPLIPRESDPRFDIHPAIMERARLSLISARLIFDSDARRVSQRASRDITATLSPPQRQAIRPAVHPSLRRTSSPCSMRPLYLLVLLTLIACGSSAPMLPASSPSSARNRRRRIRLAGRADGGREKPRNHRRAVRCGLRLRRRRHERPRRDPSHAADRNGRLARFRGRQGERLRRPLPARRDRRRADTCGSDGWRPQRPRDRNTASGYAR